MSGARQKPRVLTQNDEVLSIINSQLPYSPIKPTAHSPLTPPQMELEKCCFVGLRTEGDAHLRGLHFRHAPLWRARAMGHLSRIGAPLLSSPSPSRSSFTEAHAHFSLASYNESARAERKHGGEKTRGEKTGEATRKMRKNEKRGGVCSRSPPATHVAPGPIAHGPR